MTKKKLLEKAQEMGLEVSDSLTKAEIQAAIDAAESAEVEETDLTEYEFEDETDTATDDDVVVEVTSSDETETFGGLTEADLEENKRRKQAIADATLFLTIIHEYDRGQLRAYMKSEGIEGSEDQSNEEWISIIKASVTSKLKKPIVYGSRRRLPA